MSVIDCLESGLDFIEILGERISYNRSKNELRDIYNREFRGRRQGIRDPNFSNVLHALVKFNKVYIRQGTVFINVKSKVRVYCDQWRRPRDPQTSKTPAPPSGPSTPLNSVLTPKKKMAIKILHELRVNRIGLTSDKGGIVITSDPAASAEKVKFTVERLRELFIIKFHILNKGTDCINFTYYTALHKFHCFTLKDERNVTRACPLFLCPGESYEVVVRYTLSHYGYFPATMYFEFCPDLQGSVPFCIVREVEALAKTPLAVDLGPVSPYKPFQMVTYKPVDTMVVEGVPPVSAVFQLLQMTVKLKEYRYPYYLKELAKHRMEESEYLSAEARQRLPPVKNLLNSCLTMKTYSDRFHLLLHMEEIQMEVDIRKYDLKNQTMTKDPSNKKLLILNVPGVAENRPSVIRGDCLKVSGSEDTVQPITQYCGYVHRVELDSVKLGFSKKFLQIFVSNMKLDVEFTLNRLTLRLQHRAVEMAVKHQLEEVLFPSETAGANLPMPKLRMCNSQVGKNPQQKAAVQHIVAGSSKPAPYLVFGPPGTGKTITMVEAMNQVIRADPSAHILACAPSNSACDLLCQRLMVHMDTHQFYRLYASSRDPRTVPKNLLKHCNWDQEQDAFVFPDKSFLMKYKVIVATMFTAGRLVSGGVPTGHFTHIFVDEAGQAAEPECIMAIAGLLNARTGQLVLAGDPKQLGPIVRSRLALQHGLGLSLLERLMEQNTLYQKNEATQCFDNRFVTKLLQNYRSHAAILKIPNEKFYDGELQEFADKRERETYCNWGPLPKKGFPVIFHGVMGKDEREANSPSFFNVSEIETLMDYLTKLLDTQGKKGLPRLSAKDIGIIAPYRKQVEKIRKALRSVPALRQWGDLTELKVGCVEEFQGQERKIIMVSAVRSSMSYVKMDMNFNIGFLSNAKRLNVALTRAKSLLIVVGNPVILNKDPFWKEFISYCVKEKGYDGFNPEDAEGEDELVATLLTLKIVVDSGNPESDENPLQKDLEWKIEQ
ncbi:putative helicase mov-10-B.1 isoform X2 [Notolabrus celidotus]|uniref:putative helicase mov-10-B.1 isoform X2 n=1 Tax=Notolabrus celidotus TaxID=1203425 RepID=UPI0014900160|nr:putative helicase mov-10-B.1 isoform X2 [Notolabrus celidotus]